MEGIFLLDSSAVLAHVTEDFAVRMDKFRKDLVKCGVHCFVTESVTSECERHLVAIENFLGTELRRLLSSMLRGDRARRRRDQGAPLTWEDALSFEKAFVDLYRAHRDAISQTRLVEEWIVQQLSEVFLGDQMVAIADFFVNLATKCMETIQSIRDRYDAAVRLRHDFAGIIPAAQAPIDNALVQQLLRQNIPQGDAEHLSAARRYQKSIGKPVIFVSCDYHHIVNRKPTIWKVMGLECSDPLYAIYNLMRIQPRV